MEGSGFSREDELVKVLSQACIGLVICGETH